MSAHFAVLREAGLVDSSKQGKAIIYRLKMSVLEEALMEFSRAARPGFSATRGEGLRARNRHPQERNHEMILTRMTAAMALGGFILIAAATLKYAQAENVISPEVTKRSMQVLFGLMLAAYANVMPKDIGHWQASSRASRDRNQRCASAVGR